MREELISKKSRQIYELTKKVGCLEEQNKELTSQMDDREVMFESRMESQKLLSDTEIKLANETVEELRNLLLDADATIGDLQGKLSKP